MHAPEPQKKYLDFYGNQIELKGNDNPRQVMQLLKAKLSSPATPWNAISGRENVSLSERRLQQLHVEYRSSRVAQEAVRATLDAEQQVQRASVWAKLSDDEKAVRHEECIKECVSRVVPAMHALEPAGGDQSLIAMAVDLAAAAAVRAVEGQNRCSADHARCQTLLRQQRSTIRSLKRQRRRATERLSGGAPAATVLTALQPQRRSDGKRRNNCHGRRRQLPTTSRGVERAAFCDSTPRHRHALDIVRTHFGEVGGPMHRPERLARTRDAGAGIAGPLRRAY